MGRSGVPEQVDNSTEYLLIFIRPNNLRLGTPTCRPLSFVKISCEISPIPPCFCFWRAIASPVAPWHTAQSSQHYLSYRLHWVQFLTKYEKLVVSNEEDRHRIFAQKLHNLSLLTLGVFLTNNSCAIMHQRQSCPKFEIIKVQKYVAFKTKPKLALICQILQNLFSTNGESTITAKKCWIILLETII